VEIWKPLRHDNILELWGASYSRPFFLVSPYMFNANLLSFLRSEVGADAHKIRLMLGIADGMGYLHSRDVCHVSISWRYYAGGCTDAVTSFLGGKCYINRLIPCDKPRLD
jgi:serine/threonine protein kinase